MMEEVASVKKAKKKGVFVPLKSSGDSKENELKGTSGIKPVSPKKAKSVTLPKGKVHQPCINKKGNSDSNPALCIKSKTVESRSVAVPEKKRKKCTTPAISLSDKEYSDLFEAVLHKAMNTGFGDDASSADEATQSSQTGKSPEGPTTNPTKSGHTEKLKGDIQQKTSLDTDDKDDLDSIKSEDVDSWVDSCKGHTIDDKKVSEQPSIPSQIINKVAVKCGMSKSKQLLSPKPIKFQEPGHVYQHKKVKMAKKTNKCKNLPAQNSKDSDKEEEEETGTWIQCSNKHCHKWRYVAGIEDPILVPVQWECKMNPDKDHNSCDLPEVEYDESEHICTTFTIGSLVWAKMDGYPWWPAMVEADPDYDTYFELLTEKSMVPYLYHVTFFDDHVTRAWIRTNFISPYMEGQEPRNKMMKGRSMYKKEIQHAVNNANKAVPLSLQERVKTFGFLNRYAKKSKRSEKAKTKSTKAECESSKGNQKKKSVNKKIDKSHYSDGSSDADGSSDMEEQDPECYKPSKTRSRAPKDVVTPNQNDIDEVKSSESGTKGMDDSLTTADSAHSQDKQTEKSQDKVDIGQTAETGCGVKDNEVGDDSIISNGIDLGDKQTCPSSNQQGNGDATESKSEIEKSNESVKSLSKSNRKTSKITNKNGSMKEKIDQGEGNRTALAKPKRSEKEVRDNKETKLSDLSAGNIENDADSDEPEKKRKTSSERKVHDFNSTEDCPASSAEDPTIQNKKRDKVHCNINTSKEKIMSHIGGDSTGAKSANEECEKDGEAQDGCKPKLEDSKKMTKEQLHKMRKSTKLETNVDGEPKNECAISEESLKGKNKRNESVKSSGANKRHCNSRKNANEGINKDSLQTKKIKLSNDAEAANNGMTKSNEDDTEKQNKVDKKKSKKKAFSVPQAMTEKKSADREVPQINANDTVSKSRCLNLDHHVVPDIKNSDEDFQLDDDNPMSQILTLKKNSKLSKHNEKSYYDTNSYNEEDEEELNLDKDFGNIHPDLHSNLMNDSDEDEELDLDIDPSVDAVVVEKLTDKPQIFGRFAGICAEHGSDSDPLELIED